jgi:hypothetical protein
VRERERERESERERERERERELEPLKEVMSFASKFTHRQQRIHVLVNSGAKGLGKS